MREAAARAGGVGEHAVASRRQVRRFCLHLAAAQSHRLPKFVVAQLLAAAACVLKRAW